MKKINYLIGAAAILLTSCANDDLVRPVAPSTDGNGTAMSFAIKRANQSRATGLETVNKDFGVWAYKTQDNDGGVNASATETVMPNYLVGFHGAQDTESTLDPKPYFGYTATADVAESGTWFYAGLGSGDGAKYYDGGAVADATKSNNANQYLKYWDESYAKTYFYAYTPYDKNVTIAQVAVNNKVVITFPAGDTDWMYASAVQANTTHTSVPLNFKSPKSKLNVAFYSTIQGYDVEIIDYNGTTVEGLAFVPSKATLSPANTMSYAAQTISAIDNTAASSVEFTFDADGKITETPKSGSTGISKAGFQWAAETGAISTNSASPTSYAYKAIVPQNCDCGFTLNVSFKLTAKDTKEEVYVRGARVHVPYDAKYFDWKENHIYTFKFRITDNVPGTTGSFTEIAFSHEPNPLHALYPIVFEDVTVEDMTTTEVETIVNALTLDQTSVSVAAGATQKVTAKVLGEITGGTLTVASSDEAVATAAITGNEITITGVAAGTAVVTVKLTYTTGTAPDITTHTHYANCAVTVTAAP